MRLPPVGLTLPYINIHSEQARGLLGWWLALAQTPGAPLRDYSPYNKVDALIGGTNNPSIVNDPVRGKAWSFDGSNDYMRITSTNIPSQVGSVSMWINSNSTAGVDIIFAGSGGNDFRWNPGGSNLWGFFIGAEFRVGSGWPATGTWVHLCETWGPAGSVLYFNGAVKGSHPTQPAAFNQTTFYLGGQTGGYNGLMDDVRVYNRVLSAAEVRRLADAETAYDLIVPPAHPDAYFCCAAPDSLCLGAAGVSPGDARTAPAHASAELTRSAARLPSRQPPSAAPIARP
jgi:hypothetical protein